MTATIASITISVNWSVEEWGLDCRRCGWGHTINASRPSLAAIAQIAQDHIDEVHASDTETRLSGGDPR